MVRRSLRRALSRDGRIVLGTTRQRANLDAHTSHMDLSEDVSAWEVPPGVQAARDLRWHDLARSLREGPGRELAGERGCGVRSGRASCQARRLPCLSLDKPRLRRIEAPARDDRGRLPITEYGRQKSAAERRIADLDPGVAIVRFTKILGPTTMPLLEAWRAALLGGRRIHPFRDMPIAPIPLSTTLSVVQALLRARLPGIHHVSGAVNASYTDLALTLADELGASPSSWSRSWRRRRATRSPSPSSRRWTRPGFAARSGSTFLLSRGRSRRLWGDPRPSTSPPAACRRMPPPGMDLR